MDLHEYQAKQLLSEYDIIIPKGYVATTVEEAISTTHQLGGTAWVVKAQVHAGGRGKVGGVKICDSREKLETVTRNLLGSRLVTAQTNATGQPVDRVLITELSDIQREFYLSFLVDRSLERVILIASDQGGVEIEKTAETNPEKIIKTVIDPLIGILSYQIREVAKQLNLTGDLAKQFADLVKKLSRLFIEKDLSLLEINPLILNKHNILSCLDAKISVDDNALYRHSDLQAMYDPRQEDARENIARNWNLNYIALEGNIGCMVNGAGLAMATMDIIQLYGGSPANFLDVGGSATQERVTEAFKIILSDQNVKGILINIFGGIVRCDMIAEGIIAAVKEAAVTVPVVVRLQGNRSEIGLKKLSDSGLKIIPATTLAEAAEKIVQAVLNK